MKWAVIILLGTFIASLVAGLSVYLLLSVLTSTFDIGELSTVLALTAAVGCIPILLVGGLMSYLYHRHGLTSLPAWMVIGVTTASLLPIVPARDLPGFNLLAAFAAAGLGAAGAFWLVIRGTDRDRETT